MFCFGYQSVEATVAQRLRLFLAGRGLDADGDGAALVEHALSVIMAACHRRLRDPRIVQGEDQRPTLRALLVTLLDLTLLDDSCETACSLRAMLGPDDLGLLAALIVEEMGGDTCPLGRLYLDALDPDDPTVPEGFAFAALASYFGRIGIPASPQSLLDEIALACTPGDPATRERILGQPELAEAAAELAFEARWSGATAAFGPLVAAPLAARLGHRFGELLQGR